MATIDRIMNVIHFNMKFRGDENGEPNIEWFQNEWRQIAMTVMNRINFRNIIFNEYFYTTSSRWIRIYKHIPIPNELYNTIWEKL